jgi:cytoskeletal protein RodZ
MSVDDVSSATRIRATLVRAIESDEFEPCGGAVYARGHLRNIARAVGIDPEPLVAEFDRTHASPEVPQLAVAGAGQPTDPELAARADRRRPNWFPAMAAALVAICVLAAYGLVHRSPSHSGSGAAAPQQTQPTVEPSTAAPSTPVSPPASAVAVVPSNVAVALVRTVAGQTWLSVETFSGRVLFQGLLGPNQTKAFRDAHGLRLVIGNAPAVQLVADNHDFGTPRSSGNVAHVTVQPGGDVQFA